MVPTGERMAHVEGILEEVRGRLNRLEERSESRFNELYALMVSMWVTIILAILATLLTVSPRRDGGLSLPTIGCRMGPGQRRSGVLFVRRLLCAF